MVDQHGNDHAHANARRVKVYSSRSLGSFQRISSFLFLHVLRPDQNLHRNSHPPKPILAIQIDTFCPVVSLFGGRNPMESHWQQERHCFCSPSWLGFFRLACGVSFPTGLCGCETRTSFECCWGPNSFNVKVCYGFFVTVRLMFGNLMVAVFFCLYRLMIL